MSNRRGCRFCCWSNSESDTLNLNDIDSESIKLKHDRNIRRRDAYQFLRKLTRDGCQSSDRRLIWIKGSNASEHDMNRYEELTKTLFEGIEMRDFPQFPMFGSKCRFKTLSTEAKYCARKILVVLAVEHDSLHYCPQIPFVVEVMVQHVEEKAAFAIMNAMLSVSKINDWYFRTDFFNFRVRLRTFMDVFAENVQQVTEHINAKGIAIEKVLADGFVTMYSHYLNEETLLRLIDTFTVEGYKVLFRVGLALLTNATQALLQTNNLNEFRDVLIKESKKLDASTLSKLAFGVYLSRDKFDQLDLIHKETLLNVSKTEELEVARRWPSWDAHWTKQSCILKNKADFLQLWVWLPPQCHIGDFQLLFSTNDDGYKLSTLYDKCAGRSNLLVLIETTTNESFGFHVSSLFEAPQEERFVDTQIVTFMLSYPTKEIERQIFEPPQIQFAYLHNQPERTMSLRQLKNVSSNNLHRTNSNGNSTENLHTKQSSKNIVIENDDDMDWLTDDFDEEEIMNILDQGLEETNPKVINEKTETIEKVEKEKIMEQNNNSIGIVSELNESESKPKKKEGDTTNANEKTIERKNSLQVQMGMSMNLGRSESSPDQKTSELIIGRATTFGTNNKKKEGTLPRRSSVPLADKKKTQLKNMPSQDEFTDEEFALFDIDETKSKWRKLSLRIISPTQSLRQQSQSVHNNTNHDNKSYVEPLPLTANDRPSPKLHNSQTQEEKQDVIPFSTTSQSLPISNKNERNYAKDIKKAKNESFRTLPRDHASTYIHIPKDFMAIGDGETYAIYVDKNLNHGTTSQCAALRCPRLVQNVNGDFQIRNVEVWSVE